MDIDTIIEELDKLVHYRGQGGLVEGVAGAPKLLRQPRYQQADDPQELLVKDIKAAIARLPNDLQKEAKGLLRIDLPGQYIIDRLRLLGKAGYSGDAQHWHRRAVLGRVAGELRSLYDDAQPSYRMQTVDIHVTNGLFGKSLGGTDYTRTIHFRWTIECTVSDLRVFIFRYKTPKQLKFSQFVPGVPGPEYESAERVSVAGSPDTHWYRLFLADSLPVGVPVTLNASIIYKKANKAAPRCDYTPEIPIRNLRLSIQTLNEETPGRCVAWDDKTNKVLKEYKAKLLSETLEYDGFSSVISTSQFKVRSPKVGQRFSLIW
ncbi:MAG: hypothetical protein WA484_04510 [Solirubrobacteraceae bacterium]